MNEQKKSLWIVLKNISFLFFKRSLEPYTHYFESIRPDLLKSGIEISFIEYVYVTIFVTFLVFLSEFILFSIIFTILFANMILGILFSFTTSLFTSLIIFFFFYIYPSIEAGKRKKKIEDALPFATTYMATIAGSGAPNISVFKLLADFKEYGEISKEGEKIYRDVSAFGMDLSGAIRKTATRTPSTLFKELLWGMDTVISTGANLSDYLHDKSRSYLQEYKRRLQNYSSTVSLLMEVYLTVILVGSIFFVIMTSLMSMFGGGTGTILLMQFFVVFFGLPFVSIGFIFLLKGLAP
ncbi:MAG: type II secretion system F family protein [Candidatus Aenigmatarchaeota archaeon]